MGVSPGNYRYGGYEYPPNSHQDLLDRWDDVDGFLLVPYSDGRVDTPVFYRLESEDTWLHRVRRSLGL